MTKRPNIHRILEFHELLLQFQAIHRVTHIPVTFEQENDTEHSYNLAMTAWFLVQYFPNLDRDHVLRLALVHDLVEVHAGDTYVYADAAIIASKQQREHEALLKLEHAWGTDFPELTQHIKEYEKRASEEAKFVYALDKIMPILVIYLAEGYTWQKEGITAKRLDSIKRHKVALSPEVSPYYDELYELLVKNHHYFTGKKPAASSQQM